MNDNEPNEPNEETRQILQGTLATMRRLCTQTANQAAMLRAVANAEGISKTLQAAYEEQAEEILELSKMYAGIILKVERLLLTPAQRSSTVEEPGTPPSPLP